MSNRVGALPRPTSGVIRIACVVVARTPSDLAPGAAVKRCQVAASPFGAHVDLVADGTLVATLSGRTSARDQAGQAARCALAIRDVLPPQARLALLTGRTDDEAGLLAGVLERARELLPPAAPANAAGYRLRPISLDRTTARLLGEQFEVAIGSGTILLKRERSRAAESDRTAFEPPTEFVGREQEMLTLEAILLAVLEDRASHAVLVTAPSGGGKSRLGKEFIDRVRSKHPEAQVWFARGTPSSAAAPLDMIAQLTRSAFDAGGTATQRSRRAMLVERLAASVGEARALELAGFLGELSGVRFPEAKIAELGVARRDPALMLDHMRRAWEELVASRCSEQPLVLVLEDLHWGDAATTGFINDVLRRMRDRPLFVLALALPVVHRLFPELWSGRAMTELRLRELSRRASERLVRCLSGEHISADAVAHTVDEAAGNAFLLEELTQSLVAGEVGHPSTVQAMIEAPLASLERESRRALRAASVLGLSFSTEAVAALLDPAEAQALDARLDDLVQRELIEPRDGLDGRYGFRRATVRDAIYSMLTPAARARHHRRAAEWLEQRADSDPATVAEHFEQANDVDRAVDGYRRAAERALGAGDLVGTGPLVERAIACGATGERLAELLVLKAAASAWRGAGSEAMSCLRRAVELAPPGATVWFEALSELVSATAPWGRPPDDWVAALRDGRPADEQGSAAVAGWSRAATSLLREGFADLAAGLVERVDGAPEGARTALVATSLERLRAAQALVAGDVAGFFQWSERARAGFERAGDRRNACAQRLDAAYAQTALGAYEGAETTLREALATAEELGLVPLAALARQRLGVTLARRGALQEARALLEVAIEVMIGLGDARGLAWSRAHLAELFALAGNHEAAEREARAGLALAGEDASELRALLLATLDRSLLTLNRPVARVVSGSSP